MDRRNVLMLFYDVPMRTGTERRKYARFRKVLMAEGYVPLQESVYVKLLHSEKGIPEAVRVISAQAPGGRIHVLPLSLGRFRRMLTLQGEPFDMALFSDDIVYV